MILRPDRIESAAYLGFAADGIHREWKTGWRAVCACGRAGTIRVSRAAAHAEATAHRDSHRATA